MPSGQAVLIRSAMYSSVRRCRYFFRWQAQYSCQGSFWTTEKGYGDFLVEAGAPKDILYVQKPHVRTDLLVGIVEKLRNEILSFMVDSV